MYFRIIFWVEVSKQVINTHEIRHIYFMYICKLMKNHKIVITIFYSLKYQKSVFEI